MPLSAKIPVSCRGSQPIITADLTCLECELGVPLVACMHSHKQQGERQFGNLHTRDIKAGVYIYPIAIVILFSYKSFEFMVLSVVYINPVYKLYTQ